MTVVEATGGNTGIGLAFAAAIKGYRLVLTMPESMSTGRVALLRQLGAQVVLTPGILIGDAVAKARAIADDTSASLLLDQFRSPANPDIHRRTAAVEIWTDTDGVVDVFVSA
jgi:cysteine synthase A